MTRWHSTLELATRAALMIVVLVLLALPGCGREDHAPQGSEGGGCLPDHSCHGGLTCVVGVCLRLDGDGLDGGPGALSER